ncbi:uncharacterized protein LOC121793116 [Salvia splendens]|uniref:uncharacterized protein LOC121793116 n=1 Tax=Salvia splendens TaxID=180675 RepID=UPI001C280484|nr:uncharacterized protein LOC121793116 [Salvia splendens]
MDMDAVMMHGSFDHKSISPYKSHLKNPQKIHQNPIISNPNSFRLSRFNSTGLLQPPPPPFLRRQSSQPPLLPLPTANKKPSNPNKSKSPKKQGKISPKKSKDAAPLIGSGLRAVAAVGDQADIFSSSAVFTFSPPPSSLPLPSFSLWPKLSCKAAAGVDAGATDDLRRLLRLQ